jgi:hypothetical protein
MVVLIIKVRPIDRGWVSWVKRKVNKVRINNKVIVSLISRGSLLKC